MISVIARTSISYSVEFIYDKNSSFLANIESISKVNIIKVNSSSLQTVKKINLCNHISTLISNYEPISFLETDYVDDFLEKASKIKHTNYPIINAKGNCSGVLKIADVNDNTPKKVILVDHNEAEQSAEGIEEANILEIIDHHKIGKLNTKSPINFRNANIGSTCSIIYQLYQENKIEITKEIGGLLLAGILSDTLLFKSPTTTEMDKLACEELSKIAKVDMESYAMEMFKAGTSLDEFSIEEIVNMDFKEFDMSGKRVGIGQVFTLDIDSIFAKKDEFLSYINSTEYDMLVLAITDIIKEGSYLLYKAEDKLISEAFAVDASQGVFADGVVSRKKQLVPNLTTAIKNI